MLVVAMNSWWLASMWQLLQANVCDNCKMGAETQMT